MRSVLVACCILAFAAPAHAATATLAAVATPAAGAAPLSVTLAADGGTAPYRWSFGDGSFADGAVVQHTYAAGDWVATVTTQDGATATATVHAEAVALAAPAQGRFGRAATFTGTLTPATAGVPVALETSGTTLATGVTAGDGSFRLRVAHLRTPGPYAVRSPLAVSASARVLVQPLVSVAVVGTPVAGARFSVAVALRPAAAGSVRLEVRRGRRLVATAARHAPVRLPLRLARAGPLTVSVKTVASDGYAPATASAHAVVLQPTLALGSRGPSVRELERQLVRMHYALQRVDGLFAGDTYDAVIAFQKVNGLVRTGRLDAALWRRILHGRTPRARYRGNHVEVDKGRQVLFEVRGGRVTLAVPVSTGATGNTPLGVWHVYRRVVGFDWVLYYPTYFLRGFAIHGYPSVPPYPASHGCVRVPMWVAQRLYGLNAYGATIYVYA